MPKRIKCPGCGEYIDPYRSECGGEGEGICPVTIFAQDIARGIPQGSRRVVARGVRQEGPAVEGAARAYAGGPRCRGQAPLKKRTATRGSCFMRVKPSESPGRRVSLRTMFRAA